MMNCEEARELFSPWMDSELDFAERIALQNHLDNCNACSLELSDWENLSLILRESFNEELEAPADLSRTVMNKLRREQLSRRFDKWKKGGLGIAAALALYLGSSTMLSNPAWQIADNQPPAIEEKQPSANKQSVDNKNSDISTPSVNNSDAKDNNTDPLPAVVAQKPEAAQPSTSSPAETSQVFLNKERSIDSTLLKIRVADQAQGQQQAIKVAATMSASVEVLGRQNDGEKSYLLLNMNVPAEKAIALKNSLAAIGSEISRQENKEDLTYRFSTTLEQYRLLTNKLNSTKEQSQIKEIQEEIKLLEKQLSEWDKEAAQENIVLWLES